MARRLRTGQQLLDQLAAAVDLPGGFVDSPATFVSKTQALGYLSDSVHAFAQKHLGFGLLAAYSNFSTTTAVAGANTNTLTFNLPDGFAALIGITYAGSDGSVHRFERSDVGTIDMEGSGADWGSVRALYCILGSQLITTKPTGTYTLSMRYVPELPMLDGSAVPIYDFTLAGVATEYLLCSGSIDQWVVLDSAIKVLRRSQIDPGAMLQAKAEIERDLLNNVTDRNAVDASAVVDAWSRRGGGWT